MPKSFRLTPKQVEGQRVLGGQATHVMLFGGSRSGKTFLILRAIITRAAAAEKSRHGVLRYRFNHVKSSIVHDTFPKVMELCFPELSYHLDKTDWFAELPNGSQVWFGGLDDKERTEKILGQEYATIFLNECSQIPWNSRNLAVTRLAQRALYDDKPLRLKMYYDCNPPSKSHWSYRLFVEKRDPDSRASIDKPGDYDSYQINPIDNIENLPDNYLDTLKGLPIRLRRRFEEGNFADAVSNALWTEEIIDRWRSVYADLPDFQRVVVAVDPSGANDDEESDHDEIGVAVAALGDDGNGYFLEDLSLKAGPAKWGQIVTSAFDRHMADKVVAESNYGGEMVNHVIQTARPNTPFKLIHASRGKVIRAEPISALTEQGKIRFVGYFPEMEDELSSFTTAGYMGERSPNRADAFIWAMSELFPGLTQNRVEHEDYRHKPVDYRGRGAAGWMR